MSKVVLATVFVTAGNADPLDDLAQEVAGTSPPPADTGTIVTDTGYHSNKRESVENEQNVDLASRLQAAFQREPREALISREEAKSAARSRQRAVLELMQCRCGALFPAMNGKKRRRISWSNECREELRFCSKRCQGQHAVEIRQLVGRRAARRQVDEDGRPRDVALPELEADKTGDLRPRTEL